MSSNNASSSKPRNPLEELPLETFIRPASSQSSSSASASRSTPSSTSSLLSSGSRSSTGSGTGSTRIVHLPLSSPSQDGSSSRTVRPVGQGQGSPSARRWPSSAHRHSRGSSLSVLQTLTPGRLHSGMIHSSPLNPRASATATPSTEERRNARRLMMDEGDGAGMMDVEEEPVEDRTVRRRSIGALRERDREMMPPPEIPITLPADRSPTPGISPARRLFVAPVSDTPSRNGTTEGNGSLQPSPPLPPNTVAVASPFIDSEEQGESSGKTKSRARTSMGRESPCPPAVTEAVVDGVTRGDPGEEVAKKVRLDGKESTRWGKQRMDYEDCVSTLPPPTTTTTTEEEERLNRQRLENADPHDCGFSVWEDMNRAGPSSSGPSTSQLGTSSSSASNSTSDSPPLSMSEKNKKAMAWLTIPFDNQENVKPPPMGNRMVPFILDSKKGKPEASGCGTSSAGGPSSGSGTVKAASSTAKTVSGSTNPSPAVGVSGRSPATVRPTSSTSTRPEISIRTSMRGSIAPTDTASGGLRGPEGLSPIKVAGSGYHSQPVERAGPVLKLRRGPSSVPSLRGNASGLGATVPSVRPVLVLRRTGPAENVNTINNKSTSSRPSTESAAQEQENEVFPVSVIDELKAETIVDKPKAKTGRKKRKSDEMKDPLDARTDAGKKRPPTRSTAGPVQSSSPDVQTRGAQRTRRSAGSGTGSENKTSSGEGGKKGSENGYKGRVLRSMTCAGNGL